MCEKFYESDKGIGRIEQFYIVEKKFGLEKFVSLIYVRSFSAHDT